MARVSELTAADIAGCLKSRERNGFLRFIACGSMADGKSTLIGRLLGEAKVLSDDQLAGEAKKFAIQGDDPDLALLLDGLSPAADQVLIALGRKEIISD